ncbi:hypothetical protein [Pedobacter xixiisoli]|uniref:Uncharacterized protein n=1 Tax=Pedobacter xixiisoli TaxID=1476464 RepID=A0A286A7A0_9SPHI|nr:hypothetical protein [Pedobacter xixiisoli]SOD17701.1 hypothetical protein SAMN06297358_2644 [Pedobacter xixiisoli]
MKLGNLPHLMLDLVIADLLHTKLLYRQTELGADTSGYEFDHCTIVLLHAGFPAEEHSKELKQWYADQKDKIQAINISQYSLICQLAKEIVNKLVIWDQHKVNLAPDDN